MALGPDPIRKLQQENRQSSSQSGVLRITPASQERFVEYVRLAYLMQEDIHNQRARFEEADREYARKNDRTEETQKASNANRAGDPTKLQNVIVPVVQESVDIGTAFLAEVFLSDYPMFKFGAKPEAMDLALQWNTLVGEDQLHYGWASEFATAFLNGEKYNFAPIECDWCKEVIYKPTNGATNKGVVLEQEIWQGNKIRSIDPYNLIYDRRVDICRAHIDGEFIGYVERMTRIQFKKFVHSLGEDRLKNDVKAFEAANWVVEHYVPDINFRYAGSKKGDEGSFDWSAWVTNNQQNRIKYRNQYTVIKLYARIMPAEFGIQAPNDQTPEVWKIIVANGVVVYAQPLVNAHDYLPIIIVQPKRTNLDFQTESNAENQQPFQQMISALWNAKLQTSRRITTDRMIYNPLLIEPDHINSPNPSAKIPIKPTGYGRKLEEAVYQIPFHAENGQYWLQDAQGLSEWSLRAQGHNRVSNGQFQKGNKLQSEFQTVMANAGAQDRVKAISWETNGMFPIKVILKSNYLQFTPEGKRYNRKEDTVVDIDPVKLREEAAEFQIGDGLLPIEKLLSTDKLTQGLQYLSQDQQMAAEYNKGDMFVYLMKLAGVDKLDAFRKPPEQLNYDVAINSWNAQAARLMDLFIKNPDADPKVIAEAISSALGPMPKPPQSPQEQQQAQQNPLQQGIQNARPAA